MFDSSGIKVYVDIGEDPATWLVQGIVEENNKKFPDFTPQPQWDPKQAGKWRGHPNHRKAQETKRQAIDKGQKTAEHNGKYPVCAKDGAFINCFGKLVNALRATNCYWLADHIWISHL